MIEQLVIYVAGPLSSGADRYADDLGAYLGTSAVGPYDYWKGLHSSGTRIIILTDVVSRGGAFEAAERARRVLQHDDAVLHLVWLDKTPLDNSAGYDSKFYGLTDIRQLRNAAELTANKLKNDLGIRTYTIKPAAVGGWSIVDKSNSSRSWRVKQYEIKSFVSCRSAIVRDNPYDIASDGLEIEATLYYDPVSSKILFSLG